MTEIRMGEAIDLFIGDMATRGCTPESLRTYRRPLNQLVDVVGDRAHPREVTETHLRSVLYQGVEREWSKTTTAQYVSILHRFFAFCDDQGLIDLDPSKNLKRPRLLPAEERDVVTISSEEAARLLEAASDWQELLCIATALYLGARRSALARVRRRDVVLRAPEDERSSLVTFHEKGGKVITKPMPDEYAAILRAAEEQGVWAGPNDYLIPNRRPASVGTGERSNKVIWYTVKRVAERVGIRAHVHALRAAFAVLYDEAHPNNTLALADLMGHASTETTKIYLRRRDKAKAMETVRDLSWGGPLFPSKGHEGAYGIRTRATDNPLPEPVRRKLDSLRTVTPRRRR